MSSEKAQYIENMMRKMKAMPKPNGLPDYAKSRAFVEAAPRPAENCGGQPCP